MKTRITNNELLPEKFLASPETERESRKIAKALYRALAQGDSKTIAKLVAPDLEWWYHGPPHCQHMMRILTGQSRQLDFKFERRRIRAVGSRVIVEGWEGSKATYWVHVWTVKEGIITQFREYFNTWVTVIVKVSEDGDAIKLWQSEPRGRLNCSLPDLVLAI